MASIVKRRGRFCVVYLYTDAHGNRKQKWETYKTQAEAKARQKEIEYKTQIGTFVIPQCNTMNDLLREYVALYGKNTWAISTYSSNVGLIKNYIEPFIGNMKLKDITPRVLEKYYARLLKTKPVNNPVTGIEVYQGETLLDTVGASVRSYSAPTSFISLNRLKSPFISSPPFLC